MYVGGYQPEKPIGHFTQVCQPLQKEASINHQLSSLGAFLTFSV